MAILCPLSADQLTAAGPPIWSMLAVWYELVPYSYPTRRAPSSETARPARLVGTNAGEPDSKDSATA
eukprot:SAG25_NODE_298_length_10188_cov_5.941421_8_plen_67_part_00